MIHFSWRIYLIIVLCLAVGGFVFIQNTEAAITSQISYQGKLTNSAGAAVSDGAYSFKLSIYDAATGGNRLWTAKGTNDTPTALTATTTSGLFSVMLGDTSAGGGSQNAISLDFNTGGYYLGVTVGADSEMTPRKALGAAPYAFNSDYLDGKSEAALATLAENETISGQWTFSATTTLSSDLVVDTNTLFVNASQNRVGIGTTTPAAALHVSSGGIYFDNVSEYIKHEGIPNYAKIREGWFGPDGGGEYRWVRTYNLSINSNGYGVRDANDLIYSDQWSFDGLGGIGSRKFLYEVAAATGTAPVSWTTLFKQNTGGNTTIGGRLMIGGGGSEPSFSANLDVKAVANEEVFRFTTQGGTFFAKMNSLGYIGLLNSSPLYPLDVSGEARFSTSTATTTLLVNQGGSGYIAKFQTGGSDIFTVATTGLAYFSTQLAVATATPASNVELAVTGDGYLTGGLGVGLVNTTAGTIQSSGNATIGGNLTLSGTGTTTVTGNLDVLGNTKLGSDSTDQIETKGYFISSLLPSTNNLYDLGAYGNAWRSVYASTSAIIGGTATLNTNSLTFNTAATIDSNGTLSLNTTNNQAITTGTGLVTTGSNLYVTGTTSINSTTGTSTIAGGLVVNTNTLVVDFSGNKVGIGTNPAFTLDISSSGSRGINSLNTNESGYGIYAFSNNATTVINYGGYFQSSAQIGKAVYGFVDNTSDTQNFGGDFTSYGVQGVGVRGYTSGTSSKSVTGYAAGTGSGTAYGGHFSTYTNEGFAVYGYAGASGNVTNYGGYFRATGNTSYGVYGYVTPAANSTSYGGYFRTNTDTGVGVYGFHATTSGAGYGSYGITNSSSGWGGYFTGGYGLYGSRVFAASSTPSSAYSAFESVIHGEEFISSQLAIATSTPPSGVELAVSGDGYLTGGLGIGVVNTTAGTLQTSGIATIGGSTGTSTIAGGLTVDTNTLVVDYSGNKVGIGTNPAYTLDISSSDHGALYAVTSNTSIKTTGTRPAYEGYDKPIAVYGYTSAATSGATYGGYFVTDADQGVGVWGYAATTGAATTYGGYFHSNSTSGGYGVYGLWNGGGATVGYSVYGEGVSPGWAGYFTGGKGLYGSLMAVATATPATGVELAVLGDGYLTGGLGVGLVNTSAGTLQTSGNATIGGILAVSGTATSTIAGDLAVDTNVLYVDRINNRVGINDADNYPDYTLDITSTESRGINVTTSNTSGYAVYGDATGLTSGSTYGGYFQTVADAGYGLYAAHATSGGAGYGVYGTTSSSVGWAGYFTGSGYGIYGNRIFAASSTPSSAYSAFESVTQGEGFISSQLAIATSTPPSGVELAVSGDGYLTGGLGVGLVNTTAGTLQTSGNATIGGILAVSGTATSTIAGDLAVDTNVLYVDRINNRVGINDTDNYPDYTLDITSTESRGINVTTSNTSGYAVYGDATGLTTGSTYGGYFTTAADAGYGVYGAHATSGASVTGYGVYGTTSSSVGWAGYFTGSGYGIYGNRIFAASSTPSSAYSAFESVTHGESFISSQLAIATSTPPSGVELAVSGDGYLTGGLGVGLVNTTAGTIQSSGAGTIGGDLIVSGTGTSTIASGLTVDGTMFVVDFSGNKIGIGKNPAYAFDMGMSLTGTSGNLQVFNVQTAVTPSGASTGNYRNYFETYTTNNQDISPGGIVGLEAEARIGDAATIDDVFGIRGKSYVTNAKAAVISRLYSIVAAGPDIEDATVSSAAGIYVASPEKDTGSATNAYGIYVEGVNNIGTSRNYSIYSVGAVYVASTTEFVFLSPEHQIVLTQDSSTGKEFVSGAATGLFTISDLRDGSTANEYQEGSLVLGFSGDYGIVSTANTATSGATYAGYFITNSDIGAGVYGSSATSGAAASASGVYGISSAGAGFGVYGLNSGSGVGYGVYGQTNSTAGSAVYGRAPTASAGLTYGGFFQSAADQGRGVYAYHSTTSGAGYGVYAQTDSSTGWAGYFTGGLGLYATGTRGITIATSTAPTNAATRLLIQGGVEIPLGGLCVDNDGGCNASTTGRISAVSYITANSDIAENFYSPESLEAGDVVKIDPGHIEAVIKSNQIYERSLMGIVSTQPGYILGKEESSWYPIALAGRVLVKVSLENGPIGIGDPLTSASLPGYAMKATKAGPIVGKALQPFTGAEGETGKIMAFVNISWYEPPAVEMVASATSTTSETVASQLTDQSAGINSSGNLVVENLTVTNAVQLTHLTMYGDIDLNNNSMLNIRRLLGWQDLWSIDEFGNFVTQGTIASRIKLPDGREKIMYTLQSPEVELTISGSAQLENGEKAIIFDKLSCKEGEIFPCAEVSFSEIISDQAPMKVIITPTAETSGIYVVEKNAQGFKVKELGSGTSNATFDWLVIARRKGYEEQVASESQGIPASAGMTDVAGITETTEPAPAESQPVEVAPAETAPVEQPTAEVAPAESQPAEVVPTETAPVEQLTAEVTPTESAPVESTPTEPAPVESQPVEAAPTEVAPAEPAPVEPAPAEQQPAEPAPIE